MAVQRITLMLLNKVLVRRIFSSAREAQYLQELDELDPVMYCLTDRVS